MKKLALIAALALSLAGCAATNAALGFTVTQTELDAARNSYDGLFLAPAAHYRSLPLCLSSQTLVRNQCRDHAITVKLQAADADVAAQFDVVQAMISSGNNTGIVGAYNTLQIAVKTAESLIATYGIK